MFPIFRLLPFSISSNYRGWLIVVFIFFALGAVFTARSSLGLLMASWEEDLAWPRTFLAMGGSVVLVFMMLVSPVAGNLIDRAGPRLVIAAALFCVGVSIVLTSLMSEPWHFILFFCVLGGIGYGSLAAPQASATIAHIFKQHRGLATGIAISGASGGLLLFVPLLAASVEWVGWRTTLVGFGFIIILMAFVAWFLIQPTDKKASLRNLSGHKDLRARLSQICKNRTFLLLLLGFVICGFTTSGVIEVHFIPYAMSCGYPRFESAVALGVLSAANMGGIILAGLLADKVNRPLLLGLIYFFRGLSFLILMRITGNPELLFLFAVIFGIFDYSPMPVLASLVGTHIGERVMGLTLGLLFAGHSAGAAAGAFLGGYFYDIFQSYDFVWIVSIAIAFLAAILSWLILEKRDSNNIQAIASA